MTPTTLDITRLEQVDYKRRRRRGGRGPEATESPATFRNRTDQPLLAVTVVLLVFGLMAVFSATAHQALRETGNSFTLFLKQLLSVGMGLMVMGAVARVPFRRWDDWAQPMGAASIVLLLMTMFMGTTANGSERWIALPFGFQFQPSDVAKLSAILLMAQVCSRPINTQLGRILVNLGMVGVMALLIYQQPNLSVTLILMFVSGMMLFLSGLPWPCFLLTVPAAWVVAHKIRETEYQWRRIVGWLNPWADPQDTGYNLIQSYYAIGTGGLFGVGLGHSVSKQYYLPFQHTDFIFAVICEELGVGGLLLIALFGCMAWRGFAIAWRCPSRFGRMLAFGVTAAITLQATINIAVTIGLMPVTGVTLPLISYGGTSVIMTLWMIGILLNISRYRLAPVE